MLRFRIEIFYGIDEIKKTYEWYWMNMNFAEHTHEKLKSKFWNWMMKTWSMVSTVSKKTAQDQNICFRICFGFCSVSIFCFGRNTRVSILKKNWTSPAAFRWHKKHNIHQFTQRHFKLHLLSYCSLDESISSTYFNYIQSSSVSHKVVVFVTSDQQKTTMTESLET